MSGETVQVEATGTSPATRAGERVAVGAFVLALVLGGALLVMAAFQRLPAPAFTSLFAVWTYAAAALVAAMALVGRLLNGRFAGFLITESNVMSASRAQWALWFLAIASTYLALAVTRMAAGEAPRVDLQEGLVLTTMASGASLAAAPVINSGKAKLQPATKALETAKSGLDAQERNELEPRGTLWARRSPKSAKLADIFDGDEVGDGASLDAAKMQMLLLTVVLVFLYLLDFFKSSPTSTALPDVVSETMAAVLGVSHAGYLGSKLPQRTAVASEPAP